MKNNAWSRMGITQNHIDACDEMIQYSISDSTVLYWENCKKFLMSIHHLDYANLTSKQRNWVVNIKSDLTENGFV